MLEVYLQKYFDVVKEDHEEIGMSEDSLTLRCKALKKFLPYDGLYPAQRTLQMATLFSQSYGQFMNPNPMGSWQTALKPFYAPGIAYNSIKSGIAVDYPIYEPTKDREFNRFCTRFKANTRNYVDIGGAEKWATSAAKRRRADAHAPSPNRDGAAASATTAV